jgi:uncharacterized protein (DUF2461 family)
VTDRAYFGSGLLRFLKDLRLHNEREWFLANQQRYENDVPRAVPAVDRGCGPRSQED